MRSFNAWLKSAKITNDPVGDFIADAKDDHDFPKRVNSAQEIEDYLISCGACQDAIKTVPRVWERYRQAEAERVGALQRLMKGLKEANL